MSTRSALSFLFLSTAVALGTLSTGCASSSESPSETTTEPNVASDEVEEALTSDEQDLSKRVLCGGRAGDTCKADEYCAFRLGDICGLADASAYCAKRPKRCRNTNYKVCGCDNVTYPNPCTARKSGAAVYKRGACPGDEPQACPAGQKQCMMCGAPPPDGICRSFSCVDAKAECPLVP
jgi:hypothetical protein